MILTCPSSTIRIQTEDFDLTTEVDQLRAHHRDVGAIVSFVGTVREMNDGSEVSDMVLEHYPGMTEKALHHLVMLAKARWSVIDACVIHRVGTLRPSDHIVLVAVISTHRGDAFCACEFIIDALKTEAPFWKKEQTPEGARWVAARVADNAAMDKWRTLTTSSPRKRGSSVSNGEGYKIV